MPCDLKSKTARAKLRHKPGVDPWKPFVGDTLDRGCALMWRGHTGGAGRWVIRGANGCGKYWIEMFAVADDIETVPEGKPGDYERAIARGVLTHNQAKRRALEIFRERTAGAAAAGECRPFETLQQAIDKYEVDLRQNGVNPKNASRLYPHLTEALLGTEVRKLDDGALRSWRDSLTVKKRGERAGQPLDKAGVNRVVNSMRAALNFAALRDPRIAISHVLKVALDRLADADKAREDVVILDLTVLGRLVAEAYKVSVRFGVLVEVLMQTGARMSQVARINCRDLDGNNILTVPPSKKGRTRKRKQLLALPIEWPVRPELAARLRELRGDRTGTEPLLLNEKGVRWHDTNEGEQREPFRKAVEAAGLDPDTITSYALRHSSICRLLRTGIDILTVAKLHNTSPERIKVNYGAFIHRQGDLSRYMMPALETDNVVTLPRAA